MSQEVCPFNVKFAVEAAEPGYAARGPGERPVGVEPLAGPDVSAEALPDSPDGSGDPGAGAVHPGTDAPSLVDLLEMALDPERWEAFSRGSAIRRAGRAGFARNACVAMGNWLAEEDEPPSKAVTVLLEALSDPAPLVRGHAVWALDRISSVAARSGLKRRTSVEEDPWVRLEIISALERSRPTRK